MGGFARPGTFEEWIVIHDGVFQRCCLVIDIAEKGGVGRSEPAARA